MKKVELLKFFSCSDYYSFRVEKIDGNKVTVYYETVDCSYYFDAEVEGEITEEKIIEIWEHLSDSQKYNLRRWSLD